MHNLWKWITLLSYIHLFERYRSAQMSNHYAINLLDMNICVFLHQFNVFAGWVSQGPVCQISCRSVRCNRGCWRWRRGGERVHRLQHQHWYPLWDQVQQVADDLPFYPKCCPNTGTMIELNLPSSTQPGLHQEGGRGRRRQAHLLPSACAHPEWGLPLWDPALLHQQRCRSVLQVLHPRVWQGRQVRH